MSPQEKLAGAQAGDIIKGLPLLKGLSPDPVEIHVKGKNPAGVVLMDVRCMGIKLAGAAGKPQGNKTIWTEVK